MVAEQWMSGTHVLHDTVKDAHGNITKVGKYPSECVPELDESVLKKTPGAFEAWRGLSECLSFDCRRILRTQNYVIILKGSMLQLMVAPKLIGS